MHLRVHMPSWAGMHRAQFVSETDRPPRIQELSPGSRVLLAVTDRIGDALFRTPAIRLLAREYPALHFDALAFGNGAAEILMRQPDIGTVFTATDPARIRELARGYDLVISMRSLNRRRYLQKLDTPFISYRRTLKNTAKAEDILEFTQRHLLARPVSPADVDRRYVLPVDPADHRRADAFLRSHGIDPEHHQLIGFHAGCATIAAYNTVFKCQRWWHHKKAWPVDRFSELAKRLIAAKPYRRVIIFGSSDEAFLSNRLTRVVPGAVSLCGMSIAESAAAMDRLSLIICNDSGPMHMACARSTPVLALCGSTNPALTGPFPPSPEFRVIHKNRMKEITIADVLAEAETLLGFQARRPGSEAGGLKQALSPPGWHQPCSYLSP